MVSLKQKPYVCKLATQNSGEFRVDETPTFSSIDRVSPLPAEFHCCGEASPPSSFEKLKKVTPVHNNIAHTDNTDTSIERSTPTQEK